MLPLLWASVAFLLYRREQKDKLYLSLILCFVLAIFLVDTQGYTIPYQGLFLVPIAAFIAHIFSKQFRWAITIILIALLPTTMAWINWESVGKVISGGGLPEAEIEILGRDILSHLQLDDEFIEATHEIIWVLPAYEHLYSPMAEGLTVKQRQLTGTEVWDTLMPDIYIEIPRRQETPPYLAEYLARENFLICQSFQSGNYLVNIWQRTCE
jgi:hypothetical protein